MSKKRVRSTVAPKVARARKQDAPPIEDELESWFGSTFDLAPATVPVEPLPAPPVEPIVDDATAAQVVTAREESFGLGESAKPDVAEAVATEAIVEAATNPSAEAVAAEVALEATVDASAEALVTETTVEAPVPAPRVIGPLRSPAPAISDTARMAAALLAEAARLHAAVPVEAQAPAWLALDEFIAAPSPSRFLRALRELRGAISSHRFQHVSRVLSDRAFSRALDRLRHVAVLDDEARALLAELPVDVRAARRLDALAALLQAHDELTTRVRAPQKYKLEPLPPEPKKRTLPSSPPKKRRKR